MAAAAPWASGLAGHGRTWAARQRASARLGAPAPRPCDVGCSRWPATAAPIRGTLAEAGIAARPSRPGRPRSPGCGGRCGSAGASCEIRSCQAVDTRPAPRLRRAVGHGPRPEPGIGARAEPGVLAGPGIRTGPRPAATGIRHRSRIGPRAKTLTGMPGPPRARGVLRGLRGLRAGRGGERYARRRATVGCPRPVRPGFRANAAPGTGHATG